MKHSSFGMYHQLLNDEDEVVAEGHDVIVLYNFSRMEKLEISTALRAQVEALEERTYAPDAKA